MTCLLEKLSGFPAGKVYFQNMRKMFRDKKLNLSTRERPVQRLIFVSGTKSMDKKILCLRQRRTNLEKMDLPSASLSASCRGWREEAKP